MNILLIRVIDGDVVRFGLAICGRRKDEYIKSGKFEMSIAMSYFNRFTLKSLSITSVLFYNESFSDRFGR